ncbi:hypothetical protein GW17_00009341, partial [Ensete ventricosum]
RGKRALLLSLGGGGSREGCEFEQKRRLGGGFLSLLSSSEHFVLHCIIPSSCIRTSQSRSPTFYCDDPFVSHPDSSEKVPGVVAFLVLTA